MVPLSIKNLQTMILPVGDINPTLPVGADTVGQIEQTGVSAIIAPGKQMLPLWREFVNAGISVAIGAVEVSGFGVEGDFGGPIKGLATLSNGSLISSADRAEKLAI